MVTYSRLYKTLSIILIITITTSMVPAPVWAIWGQQWFGVQPVHAASAVTSPADLLATRLEPESVEPINTLPSEIRQHLGMSRPHPGLDLGPMDSLPGIYEYPPTRRLETDPLPQLAYPHPRSAYFPATTTSLTSISNAGPAEIVPPPVSLAPAPMLLVRTPTPAVGNPLRVPEQRPKFYLQPAPAPRPEVIPLANQPVPQATPGADSLVLGSSDSALPATSLTAARLQAQTEAPATSSGEGSLAPARREPNPPPHPPGMVGYDALPGPSAVHIIMNDALGASISMEPGWHLISIPAEPADTAPAAVLASIAGSYRQVYAYDGCDLADPWKLYDPADPDSSDLTAIDHTLGLWIEMTETDTLDISWKQPASTVIRLCRGWNMIGYPAGLALPVSSALSSIEGRYDRVFAWDAMDTADPWAFFAVGAPNWANDLQMMEPGRGYWVHASQDTALVIEPPSTPPQMDIPGCIASPETRSRVSEPAPIILQEGGTLHSVMVDYWPVNDLNAVQVLATAAEAAGGSTVATLDTTVIPNGSYAIRVSGVDESGERVACGVMVTVEGEYKPGRVRFTVNDLTVPVVGLPIEVGRTYDSLERNQVGDFGYGWSLALGNPKLEVDPDHNVTVTMPNGKRVTFYYAPQMIFAFGIPNYVPEPGVYGSLKAKACGLVVNSGGQWVCFPGNLYQQSVSGYVYTDPYGREFDMGTDGRLRSIKDLNGNMLVFGADGIISSAGGLKVRFDRDNEGRITAITDPMDNVYSYEYDAAGNLVRVNLPGVDEPIRYTYNSEHHFLSVEDPRSNVLATATYYPDSRLESETDALGHTYRYAYDLDVRTTTVTNPDGGRITTTYNSYGMVVSETDALSRTTTYTYDSNHNRKSRTDALGNTTHYTYDSNGNRTSVTDPLGNTNHMAYNQYGGPTSVTDALGNVKTVSYDAGFMPINIHDDLGTFSGYTWDSHGNLLTRSNGNGEVTRFAYDQYGNLINETDPLDHTTIYTYDQLGRKISSTDPLSNTTLYSYSALGHTLVITEPLSRITRYEYDANGNRTAVVDPNGEHKTYTYDAANRLTKVTHPDDSSENYTYDWRGNRLTATDQAGHVTRYGYDLAGQLVSVTYADGTTDAGSVLSRYDAAGRVVSETDALGHTTIYAYDDAGRLLSVTDPLSRTISYTYDDAGQRISTTDANTHQTHYIYDSRGRLIETIFADSTTQQQSYDGAGNLLSSTDQAGKMTCYSYDDTGRLLSVTNPMNHTTHYTYDAVGDLLSITDANGHETKFTYDALHRQTRKTWPDDSFESFDYDVLGNQVSHRLADGDTNTFSYDALNRLTQINYFDGQTVGYTYTPDGNRQTVTDGRGITRYEYDDRNRLTQIVQPGGEVISYIYDLVGNRLSLTTPAGTTTYTYDAANQLASVTDWQDHTVTYTYNNVGLHTEMIYPNGVTVDYTYDQLNRLTDIAQRKDGLTIDSYHYTLDPAGNRLSVIERDGNSIQWNYNDAYRLIGETHLDSTGAVASQTNYSYDPVGNRLTKTFNDVTTTYQYNVLDQLVSVGVAQYQYDGRGNLVQVTDGADITHYNYDAADRLASAILPDGSTISFDYDAAGRRVRQTIDTQVTRYLWDEASLYGNVVLETDESGGTIASYVLGDNQLLAQNRNGAVSYYLSDGQESIRALTNSTGDVTDRYSYTAFGELRGQQGTTVNPYLYTGQQFDVSTGLYNLRARYYSPVEGRFLSRDAFDATLNNPIELNRYAYVANNPVNFMDPTGHTLVGTAHINRQSITAGSIALPKIGAQLGAMFVLANALLIMGGDLIVIVAVDLAEITTQAISFEKTREAIKMAEDRVVDRSGKRRDQVKILYRGTSMVDIYRPKPQLWLSEHVFYVTIYSHAHAAIDRSTPVVCIYAILLKDFESLLASGQIEPRFSNGLEYGFSPLAQASLIGPVVVPIPNGFKE